LGSDNGGLFFLTSLVDYERSSLGFLLGYLFGFYSSSEFGRKGQVLNGFDRGQ
jgi:hypothetical protein